MAKKSAAQIRRMEKRAAARGEEFNYTPPPPPTTTTTTTTEEENKEEEATKATSTPTNDNDDDNDDTNTEQKNDDETTTKLLAIGKRLEMELQEIEADTELKAKDRRSKKRKVEAIAAEESGGMSIEKLLEFCKEHSAKNNNNNNNPNNEGNNGNDNDKYNFDEATIQKLAKVAEALQNELEVIEKNEELKAKDRRSAKRKAEAIAFEDVSTEFSSTTELLEWYTQHHLKKNKNKKINNNKESNDKQKKRKDPYIAFIGQMSYDTTKEELFQHIQSQLREEFPTKKITSSTISIRMLTDPKTKKSRGMAFVQVENDDPKILYALLKMHQTFLKGRRINVERSAGGKKNNEARKMKITQFRKEQKEYFNHVVDNILKEYRQTGELRDDELDEGVIALCKRHAGPVVRAAVSKYIEGSGRDMDNPSAYLTYLITKFAKEGVYPEDGKDGNGKEGGSKSKHTQKPNPKRKRDDNNNNNNNNNTTTTAGKSSDDARTSKQFKSSSKFSKSGIDMSISESAKGDVTKIFPSASRGRGRGYM